MTTADRASPKFDAGTDHPAASDGTARAITWSGTVLPAWHARGARAYPPSWATISER